MRFHNYLVLFIILLGANNAFAQFISHGPVWGALTDHSVKVYIRTLEASAIGLKIAHPDKKISSARIELLHQNTDNSKMYQVSNLLPDTPYHVVFIVNGVQDTVKGQFRTAPESGGSKSFSFVTGSCQETDNMKVFDVIGKYDPLFFLHTGDFTYPDYQIASDYSADMDILAYSYRKRYQEKKMDQLLKGLPIDYIYDDNDYVGASGGRYYKNHTVSEVKPFNVRNEFHSFRFPDFWRTNCINAYTQYFPAYELPDTSEGIYHSFKIANAEFFFLDRNSAKEKPLEYAFKYDEKRKRWKFDPPEDYTLYGEKQIKWLKQGLLNSTADWKFIVSGVPFNRKLRDLIHFGIKYQKLGWDDYSGFHIATGLAYYWAAHVKEYDDFMRFLEDEDISDIIFISGDTHHNTMDDGANAGYPEMNASGLSVSGTHLGLGLKLVGWLADEFKYGKEIWNQGGNGLGNWNKKNAFGMVDVVGKSHVQLQIIDEDNEILGSFKVMHSSEEK